MKFKFGSFFNCFIIFEHLPLIFFTSKTNNLNHYNYYIPQHYFKILNLVLSLELNLNFNFLIDLSAIDLQKTKQNWIFKKLKKNINNILLYSIYFIYFLKIKISIFSFLKKQFCKNYFYSIEDIFFNSNWLEREVSEMFNIYFFNKIDNRNLLLEYSSMYNPMLKNFPCEGYFEIYYNFFNENISFLKIESIEL